MKYATGYIALGRADEAVVELLRIAEIEAQCPDVYLARLNAYEAARDWRNLWGLARETTRRHPGLEQGWIAGGVALLNLEMHKEAKRHLFRGWARHDHRSPRLHYLLARAYTVLGYMNEAMGHLVDAFQGDESLRSAALAEPDLAPLREDIPFI